MEKKKVGYAFKIEGKEYCFSDNGNIKDVSTNRKIKSGPVSNEMVKKLIDSKRVSNDEKYATLEKLDCGYYNDEVREKIEASYQNLDSETGAIHEPYWKALMLVKDAANKLSKIKTPEVEIDFSEQE